MAPVRRFIALQIGPLLATGCIVFASSQSFAQAGASGTTSESPTTAQIPVVANPSAASAALSAERKHISEMIEQLRAKGTNVRNYEMVQKYIEDRLHSGDPPGSVKNSVDELTTNLINELNGVPHPVVHASHITSASSAQGGTPPGWPHKSSAEQYAEEMRKTNEQKNNDYKAAHSKDFWQKFHDEFGKKN